MHRFAAGAWSGRIVTSTRSFNRRAGLLRRQSINILPVSSRHDRAPGAAGRDVNRIVDNNWKLVAREATFVYTRARRGPRGLNAESV